MSRAPGKVVFFFPKFASNEATAPLGILAVATPLLRAGYKVRIIDSTITPDPLAHVLVEIRDAVCLAVSLVTGPMIRETARSRGRPSGFIPGCRLSWVGGIRHCCRNKRLRHGIRRHRRQGTRRRSAAAKSCNVSKTEHHSQESMGSDTRRMVKADLQSAQSAQTHSRYAAKRRTSLPTSTLTRDCADAAGPCIYPALPARIAAPTAPTKAYTAGHWNAPGAGTGCRRNCESCLAIRASARVGRR